MVAAPYEMFNMGNKTHPQQPDIGESHCECYFIDVKNGPKARKKSLYKH